MGMRLRSGRCNVCTFSIKYMVLITCTVYCWMLHCYIRLSWNSCKKLMKIYQQRFYWRVHNEHVHVRRLIVCYWHIYNSMITYLFTRTAHTKSCLAHPYTFISTKHFAHFVKWNTVYGNGHWISWLYAYFKFLSTSDSKTINDFVGPIVALTAIVSRQKYKVH